ncbi:MAG: PorP/SprF family type IX secretion system membrane protein [Bacteroidales bacterium]|nr:PorP/SprF family type IX secretion system membrane protein [Bacteroidales bacterium]MBN2819291.1 PorP/SprF family type IX secretion system membrane protein [Bacteroidales bacterium]
MKKTVILFISFVFSSALFAQQLAVHNQYYLNSSLVNPAATAITDCKTFGISDKHQWLGIQGAPSIQTFYAQVPKQFSKYKKHGLGANLVRDNNGATQNLGCELIYTFQMFLGRSNTRLSLGLSGKLGQYTFDERDFTEYLIDPAISRTVFSEFYYNAASGFYLYSDRFFGGLAVYNLLPLSTEYYLEYGNDSFFSTLLAGYYFKPRKNKFNIKSTVYIARGENLLQVDLKNRICFENQISSGILIRKYLGDLMSANQNVILFVGYDLDKWNFQYCFDLGINRLQMNNYGSHQVSVGYRICRDIYDCPTYDKSK